MSKPLSASSGSVSAVGIWRRGLLVAWHILGLLVLVGAGFELLRIVADAINNETLRLVFQLLVVAGGYLCLIVPLVCYLFAVTLHRTMSRWEVLWPPTFLTKRAVEEAPPAQTPQDAQ